MQNPYNMYKKNQGSSPQVSAKKKVKQKARKKVAPKKSPTKAKPNTLVLLGCFFGLGASFYIFAYTDQFMGQLSNIQVGMTQSRAADGEKAATSTDGKAAKATALPVGKVSHLKSDGDHLTMKNASVYKALKDKRRELEKKERRLAQLEEELQIQKAEIEKQLKEMNAMRRDISSKLDQKVVADQESINKLVGVYANMKPQNAAIIISQIDDDLAVKVLGKMKKQNVAAILNFVKPDKAQMLSEKFTGMKK